MQIFITDLQPLKSKKVAWKTECNKHCHSLSYRLSVLVCSQTAFTSNKLNWTKQGLC